MASDDSATMRICVSAASKRVVAAREDDLLTPKGIAINPMKVAGALYTELKIWLEISCFKKQEIAKAGSAVTSRYAREWKFGQDDKGNQVNTMRLRLVLRGYTDWAAIDVETFSRCSQTFQSETTGK